MNAHNIDRFPHWCLWLLLAVLIVLLVAELDLIRTLWMLLRESKDDLRLFKKQDNRKGNKEDRENH